MSSIYGILDQEIENQSEDDKRLAYISKYRREFVLCPAFLNTKDELPQLDWHTVKFAEEGVTLPNRQGVYAFSVNAVHGNLPTNSYILYVGKAGDVTTSNTIRARYSNYIREKRVQTRASIHRMLNLWDGHLYYHYAEVPEGVSTGDIEKQLTTIFIPPYNTNDFVAEVRNLLRGASIL